MKFFEKENDNRDYVLENIKKKYTDEYIIGKEIPVPYRQIYIPKKDKTIELEIWCFKQDICIYKILYEKNIKSRDVSINHKDNEIIKIKLEKDGEKDVVLPLLIIETKMAKTVNTHELLAYSEKVQMIKTIFPYCKYLLLLFGKPPKRAYLHGLNFDRIIGIEDLSDNEINYIHKTIHDELFEVKESIYNISLEKTSKNMEIN
jgi:hypothetical protein